MGVYDQAPIYEAPRNDVVLDLGCGDGRFAISLANRGNLVVAVDKNYPSQRIPCPNVLYVRKDIRKFPIEPSRYGLVFARNVFSFLESREEINAMLDRCVFGLRRGGILDFSLFGPEDWRVASETPRIVVYQKDELPNLPLQRIHFSEFKDLAGAEDGKQHHFHIYRLVFKN